MEFIYHIFYVCLRLRFLDVETNQGLGRTPAPVVLYLLSAEYSAVMCGAWPWYLSDLTVASSQYDMLLCSETMVSDMRHVSEVLIPGFGRPVLLCRARCLGPVGWLHTFEMVTEHFTNPNLSVVVAKCWLLGFVV